MQQQERRSAAAGAGKDLIVQVGKELGPSNPRASKRTDVAQLRLASTLAKAGQKDAARGIYQGLASDGADKAQEEGRQNGARAVGLRSLGCDRNDA